MKKILSVLTLCAILLIAAPTSMRADWSMGTARFKGNMPQKSMSTGTIKIYYNGDLKKVGSRGTVDLWECTGECCIIYPKNYNGRMIEVKSPKPVQVQTLK